MSYFPKRRRAMHGFGDFSDESPCASIPAGDPYRKPGNYCATPDGGYTTFNPDGSTYMAPATVGPGQPGGGILDKITGALSAALAPRPVLTPPIAAPQGMSTTTKIVLAGGAVLLVAMLARR